MNKLGQKGKCTFLIQNKKSALLLELSNCQNLSILVKNTYLLFPTYQVAPSFSQRKGISKSYLCRFLVPLLKRQSAYPAFRELKEFFLIEICDLEAINEIKRKKSQVHLTYKPCYNCETQRKQEAELNDSKFADNEFKNIRQIPNWLFNKDFSKSNRAEYFQQLKLEKRVFRLQCLSQTPRQNQLADWKSSHALGKHSRLAQNLISSAHYFVFFMF